MGRRTSPQPSGRDDATQELAGRLAADTERLYRFAETALHRSPPRRDWCGGGPVRGDLHSPAAGRPGAAAGRAGPALAFLANLLHAATVSGGRVAVVLTMRSDFLGAVRLRALNAVLSAQQEQVGPMQRRELREAIERPAILAGCGVEPALTERLLADVAGQPGALPLLQFALTEIWKERDARGSLTLRAYEKLGKMKGASSGASRGSSTVAPTRSIGELPAKDQELCKRLFLRLVQPGEGTEDTKRRASFGELVPAGSDAESVESSSAAWPTPA